MKKSKKIEQKYSPKFEIVLQVRDHIGKITGKKVTYSTDNSTDLDEFYQRNCYREKRVENKNETERNNSRKINRKNTKTVGNNSVK